MKPIVIGFLLSFVGAVGWVFSVVIAVATFGQVKFLAQLFGILMFAGLPVGVIISILRRSLRKR